MTALTCFVYPLVPVFIVCDFDELSVPVFSITGLHKRGGSFGGYYADSGYSKYQEVFPPHHFGVEPPGEYTHRYERDDQTEIDQHVCLLLVTKLTPSHTVHLPLDLKPDACPVSRHAWQGMPFRLIFLNHALKHFRLQK